MNSIRTVQQFNRKIVLVWLGTNMSVKSGGVEVVLQTG